MNILFLSIICSTLFASTSSYAMELPNRNIVAKPTAIWSFPIATALTTMIVGTRQSIEPSIKKLEDYSDWETITKETEKTASRNASPLNSVLSLQTHQSTSSNSLEKFTLEIPNASEKPSKKRSCLDSYAADHNLPHITRDDINWEKTNVFNKSRLNNSNESLDSTTSSENNFAENNAEILATLQKEHVKISKPEDSSPINRDQSPASSPQSQICKKTLIGTITRVFSNVMQRVDNFFDDMATTIENGEAHQEHSLDSIKD